LPEVPNLKVDGFVVRLMKSLSTWGVSGTGVRPYAQSGKAHRQYQSNINEKI
jgi:hypothetical protein